MASHSMRWSVAEKRSQSVDGEIQMSEEEEVTTTEEAEEEAEEEDPLDDIELVD